MRTLAAIAVRVLAGIAVVTLAAGCRGAGQSTSAVRHPVLASSKSGAVTASATFECSSWTPGSLSWVGPNGVWPRPGRRCHSRAEPAGLITESLATDRTVSYRLAYRHSGCPGPCDPLLQTTATGKDRWRTLRRVGSGFGAAVAAAGPLLVITVSGDPAGGAQQAHTGYLISTDRGRHWHWRTDPCGGQGVRHEWDTNAIAVTPHQIWAVCIKRFPRHSAALVVSRNQGRTFTPRRRITRRHLETLEFPGRQ